nr:MULTISPECIES: VWA domain-containing protein [unclassified Clostridium]
MTIFQRAFGQKKGNNVQRSVNNTTTNDNPVIEDVGRGGIQWITERHVACVFLLDTSASMTANDAIGKLNAGLRTFKEQTVNDSSFDEHTKACIDVALVSFGPDVQVQQKFTAVSEMVPPTLTANGGTPMGAAIDKALDMITAQKARYNEIGTPYYRPWIFCITDGGPNDSYVAAAQRLRKMEDEERVLGYCVGVANFDRRTMASIFNTERIFELENLNFPALFKFVSSSLATVRNSDPNGGRTMAIEAPSDLHTINIAF